MFVSKPHRNHNNTNTDSISMAQVICQDPVKEIKGLAKRGVINRRKLSAMKRAE